MSAIMAPRETARRTMVRQYAKPWRLRSRRGPAPGWCSISVVRSKNCRLENNTIYTAKYGMTHSLSDNRGRIHVKGVKITFRPGTDRLITTAKDGFHCKHKER